VSAAFEIPEVDYTDYSNRQLAAVPLAVLAVALLVILGWYAVTGAPVSPGMAFTGGTELRLVVDGDNPRAQIEAAFDVEPTNVQEVVGEENVWIVTFDQETASAAESGLGEQARASGLEVRSQQTVSPSFGGDSQTTALIGVVVAFLGMSALVFLVFRTFVPSVAVVLSAFSDIMIPVAVMNLLNIKLTLGTVAALLMLIGYSVDSDILLNNHVLRRSGDFYESVQQAMRTGVTMTLTSLSTMIVMTVVAAGFGIQLLSAIGIILTVGLTADLMNTYLLNVSLLRWYKFEGVSR
jgi:preprotein translocase subunit SecF